MKKPRSYQYTYKGINQIALTRRISTHKMYYSHTADQKPQCEEYAIQMYRHSRNIEVGCNVPHDVLQAAGHL